MLLIAVKIGIAIVAGYLFYLFWFRKHWNIDDWPEDDELDMNEVNASCSCCGGQSLWRSALIRTANTTVFLVITMLILNTIIYLLGADSLAAILLQGSRLQPVLCALIGLIPAVPCRCCSCSCLPQVPSALAV